jgi:hypothetical protein
MILPESIADNSQLNFISYPDPHSGHLKQYILSDDERNIYELNQTNEKYRGWFIDDTIQSGIGDTIIRVLTVFVYRW